MLTATLLLALAQATPEVTAQPVSPPRVAWYTSWEQAQADAQRLNRPILLQSAAPQCSGVPGMW